MRARSTVWWACHWTLTAAIGLTATAPFTGPYTPAVGLLAATAVCLIGAATAPHPGAQR